MIESIWFALNDSDGRNSRLCQCTLVPTANADTGEPGYRLWFCSLHRGVPQGHAVRDSDGRSRWGVECPRCFTRQHFREAAGNTHVCETPACQLEFVVPEGAKTVAEARR